MECNYCFRMKFKQRKHLEKSSDTQNGHSSILGLAEDEPFSNKEEWKARK